MSTTPGALEIVREAMDRMRTPVAVDVPPLREERAAAWGRMTETLAGWSAPDKAVFDLRPGAVNYVRGPTDIAKLVGRLTKLTEAYDVRGQALRETYEERDRALAKVAEMQAQLAVFTAQNVRSLDEKPEPPAILRAIRPSRTDPRRLGLA